MTLSINNRKQVPSQQATNYLMKIIKHSQHRDQRMWKSLRNGEAWGALWMQELRSGAIKWKTSGVGGQECGMGALVWKVQGQTCTFARSHLSLAQSSWDSARVESC